MHSAGEIFLPQLMMMFTFTDRLMGRLQIGVDWSRMTGPYSHLEVNTVLVMRIILKQRPLWAAFYYKPNISIYCIYVSRLHIIADGGRSFSQKCQLGVDNLGSKCSQLWEFKLT